MTGLEQQIEYVDGEIATARRLLVDEQAQKPQVRSPAHIKEFQESIATLEAIRGSLTELQRLGRAVGIAA